VRSEYDVIIIGAGPGGSVAARTAADKCDVLLIEKRQEIGAPVRCGEAVPKRVLLNFVQPDKKWISSNIRAFRVFAPDGTMITLSTEAMGIGDDFVYILERKIFDRELVKQAARAGADVSVRTRATGLLFEDGRVRGVKIKRLGEDFEVRSKVVIGADGVESQVGRWAGIDTTLALEDAGICAQYLMTNVDVTEFCDIYLSSRAAGGYAWVFPKGEMLANVGIGMQASRLNGRSSIDYLNEFVSKQFPEGQQLELAMGCVPLSDALKTAICDGLMLVGDAARHCDPLIGAGIITAMEGGKIAGEVATKAVQLQDASVQVLSEYEIRRRQTFLGNRQKHNYRIKNFMTSLSDHELNKFIRALKGTRLQEMSVISVGMRLIAATPKILFVMRDLARLAEFVDEL
jgi:digeranylgeranylglycerophospholipid reductase